ncbi:MAG: peptidoglycan recognition protein family protein [Planctomycetota bacterium]
MKAVRKHPLIFRLLIACLCMFCFAGCMYNDEPIPQISSRANNSNQASNPVLPVPRRPQSNWFESDKYIPAKWLPPVSLEKKWIAIVLHHSATNTGNAAIFDKRHREDKHWDGIGYDFVIGNGTDSGDGQVEVTYRWRKQKTGAHCGGTPSNWANEKAIGICLVGDFSKSSPGLVQMQSTLKLVGFLQDRYHIRKSRIYGHGNTPGARVTDCPGKKFPMAWLKSMLNF